MNIINGIRIGGANLIPLNSIALDSFVLNCANISKLIWPYINPNPTPKKQEEIDKMKRRAKRRTHLEKFFPETDYPNLKNKDFRNFLEHNDDQLDSWEDSSNHHNIATNTMEFSKGVSEGKITGNITI